MPRVSSTLIVAALFAAISALPGAAHHGWSWTTGGNIDLTGFVKAAKLGNPHGVLTMDVEGQVWTVEVGQPWRNERAGLKNSDFAPGKELRIVGEPSAKKGDRKMKAEKIYINGKLHDLYPGRN